MKLFADELRTFPDPRLTLDEGILAVGDDLRLERLFEAYSFGIFPWPHEGYPVLWYSPLKRGVLDFAEFRVPQSLAKFARKVNFKYTFNRDFAAVLKACAEAKRPGQAGTWITPKLFRAYLEFHHAGYVHSLEVWEDGALVGGMYGVYVAGVFCGESMFFRRSNASKMALVKMVEFLRGQGLTWMDIQMVTPLSELMGGKYIEREKFLRRLEISKMSAKEIQFNSSNLM